MIDQALYEAQKAMQYQQRHGRTPVAKPDDRHMVTPHVSGNCAVPTGAVPHLCGSSVHVIGVQMFCAAHCPECNPPALPERTGKVEGLVGVQGGLFV